MIERYMLNIVFFSFALGEKVWHLPNHVSGTNKYFLLFFSVSKPWFSGGGVHWDVSRNEKMRTRCKIDLIAELQFGYITCEVSVTWHLSVKYTNITYSVAQTLMQRFKNWTVHTWKKDYQAVYKPSLNNC